MAISNTWNTDFNTNPTSDDKAKLVADMVQETRELTHERLNQEHYVELTGTQANHGIHRKGSAVAYVQASAPTTRPDGITSLDSSDEGRLWVHSTSGVVYRYNGSAWVATSFDPGLISVSLTNIADSTEPEVASGSYIIVDGTLVTFTDNTAITGWSSISDSAFAHIICDDAGAVSWSASAPSWDETRKGWYVGDSRVLGGAYRYSATAWHFKFALTGRFTTQGVSNTMAHVLDYAAGASGTLVRPVFVQTLAVYARGGGGNGGQDYYEFAGGGGGGGGAAVDAVVDVSDITSFAYSVGAAATATTFGGFISAGGGSTGASSSGGDAAGGAGGVASITTDKARSYIATNGVAGQSGTYTPSRRGGYGGDCGRLNAYVAIPFNVLWAGAGGATVTSTGNGNSGTTYGGGGGGSLGTTGQHYTPGAGAPGRLVLVF